MSITLLALSMVSGKPLSHQLATSGDALATNNFGHVANASPDVARQRQYIASTSSAVVSRRQRFVKLGDFFGMFKKIAKPRQRSPVNKASSIGRQRLANHRQATPAARQCVVNRSSVFLDLQRWISIYIVIGNIEIILNCQNYTWKFDKWTLSLSMHGIQKKLKEERRKIKYQHMILVLWI